MLSVKRRFGFHTSSSCLLHKCSASRMPCHRRGSRRVKSQCRPAHSRGRPRAVGWTSCAWLRGGTSVTARFPEACRGFQRLPGTIRGLQGLPGASTGFKWLARVFRGIPRVSEVVHRSKVSNNARTLTFRASIVVEWGIRARLRAKAGTVGMVQRHESRCGTPNPPRLRKSAISGNPCDPGVFGCWGDLLGANPMGGAPIP